MQKDCENPRQPSLFLPACVFWTNRRPLIPLECRPLGTAPRPGSVTVHLQRSCLPSRKPEKDTWKVQLSQQVFGGPDTKRLALWKGGGWWEFSGSVWIWHR